MGSGFRCRSLLRHRRITAMLAPRAGVAELVAEASSEAPPQTNEHVLLKVKERTPVAAHSCGAKPPY